MFVSIPFMTDRQGRARTRDPVEHGLHLVEAVPRATIILTLRHRRHGGAVQCELAR